MYVYKSNVLKCKQQEECTFGFEVLIQVFIFWDLTPCSPTKVARSYGGNSRWLLGKLVTSQKIALFMVTAATSSDPADTSSQLLSAEIAPGHSSLHGNADGTLPGIGRDRFLTVRHPSYLWTLCALDTESVPN
jgi:hypothetical protein